MIAARLGGTGAGREGVREGLKAMSRRVVTHAARGLISSAALHVVRLIERLGSASLTSGSCHVKCVEDCTKMKAVVVLLLRL